MGRKIDYLSFEAAREFSRELCLKNKEEWTRYSKGEIPDRPPKPIDIPSRVDKIYKGKGWLGFDDFLGTKRNKELRRTFRSFDQARAFSRRLGLSNQQEWNIYVNGDKKDMPHLPEDIPPRPDEMYQDKGWISWADFLNDRYTPPVIESRGFVEARNFARALSLASIREWERFRNGEMPDRGICPEDIPVWPPHTYMNKGWVSWADWLGMTIGTRG